MVTPRRAALLLGFAALLAAPVDVRPDEPEEEEEEGGAQVERTFRREERGRHWILPDHLTAQVAGNVGFVALGGGHEMANGRVLGDLLVGWVPESVGGTDIFQLSAKVTWSPWVLRFGSGWKVRPVTTGLQVTYLLGGRYFVVQPDRYPRGYYDVPTALHPALSAGAALTVPKRYFEVPVSLYAEVVALGHMLRVWAKNPATIGPEDVFSFAMGARFRI